MYPRVSRTFDSKIFSTIYGYLWSALCKLNDYSEWILREHFVIYVVLYFHRDYINSFCKSMENALLIDIHAKRFRSPNKLKVHGRGSYMLAGFATMIVKLRSKANLS